MKTPKLIPLDMSLAHEHRHPHIRANKQYLCLIGSDFITGRFEKEWYGWDFDNYGQFDAPGYNSSEWKQIWEIKK
jgi:hypothetical protein